MPNTGRDSRPVIPVAAACLINSQGEVLICQRPVGKIAAGKWEFPGGKIEAGESAREALARELREELGIEVLEAQPLIRITHEYSDRTVRLDAWCVTRFNGELRAQEAPALAWVRPEGLASWDLLAADAPLVTALRLPSDYVFTPPVAAAAEWTAGLAALPRGALLRLRCPQLKDAAYEKLARELLPQCEVLNLHLMLDRAPELAQSLGAAGWHASARRLGDLKQRPVPASLWFSASCHDAGEIRRARELGVDFLVAGPVQATSTHPDRAPMGWEAFSALAQAAGCPVYAIGGLGPAELAAARRHAAQGVAGISAYWSLRSGSGSAGAGSSAGTR